MYSFPRIVSLFLALAVALLPGLAARGSGTDGYPVELASSSPSRYGAFGRVAGIPDLNGDGRGDVVVSASGEAVGGRVYVHSGLTGDVLSTLTGPSSTDYSGFGSALDVMPDLNGDGKWEILVGASGETVAGNIGAGRAYILSGAGGGVLQTLVTPNPKASGGFGGSVARIGDVNSDGKSDVLVGALSEDAASTTGSGRAYVFSGASGALLSTLVSPNATSGGAFGSSVAAVPDVNGDGVQDIVVAALYEKRVYVFSGATRSLLQTLISPVGSGYFGISAAGVPDLSGDGSGDVLVGDFWADPDGISDAGQAFLFSGASGALLTSLTSPYKITGAQFGAKVGALDDIDGDGVADLAIGATRDYAGGARWTGSVYVFSGATRRFLQIVASIDPKEFGLFGGGLASVPDANGDGLAELVVGARGEDAAGVIGAGHAYVFYSGPLMFGPTCFDDHFDSAALTQKIWKTSAGAFPTLSGSQLQLTSAVLQMKYGYTGPQIAFEITGARYASLPTTLSQIGFDLLGGNGAVGLGTFYASWIAQPEWWEMTGFSIGTLEGASILDFGPEPPAPDPFDLLFLVTPRGSWIFKSGWSVGGCTYVNSSLGIYKFQIMAEDDARFTAERVRIVSGDNTNPAFRDVPTGATPATRMGNTAVTLTITNDSFSDNFVKIEKIAGNPPSFPQTSLPYYWKVEGMNDAIFTATLQFGYSTADLAGRGLAESALRLYRSDNNGATWTQVSAVVDPAAHSCTAAGVTQFSLWALGGPSAGGPAAAREWSLFH
jgi:glycosylphosphatidylinositol phospholipase D